MIDYYIDLKFSFGLCFNSNSLCSTGIEFNTLFWFGPTVHSFRRACESERSRWSQINRQASAITLLHIYLLLHFKHILRDIKSYFRQVYAIFDMACFLLLAFMAFVLHHRFNDKEVGFCRYMLICHVISTCNRIPYADAGLVMVYRMCNMAKQRPISMGFFCLFVCLFVSCIVFVTLVICD